MSTARRADESSGSAKAGLAIRARWSRATEAVASGRARVRADAPAEPAVLRWFTARDGGRRHRVPPVRAHSNQRQVADKPVCRWGVPDARADVCVVGRRMRLAAANEGRREQEQASRPQGVQMTHDGLVSPGRMAQIDPSTHGGAPPQVQPAGGQLSAGSQEWPDRQMTEATSNEPAVVAAPQLAQAVCPRPSHTPGFGGALQMHVSDANASRPTSMPTSAGGWARPQPRRRPNKSAATRVIALCASKSSHS